MNEKVFLGAAVLLLLSGCTTQSVVPVPHDVAACEVCVTPDASDRKVAYTATLNALRQKGFTVREVPSGATGDCKAVLTCQTVSRWDMANFTATIAYEWFENGKLLGSAKYHAANGLNFFEIHQYGREGERASQPDAPRYAGAPDAIRRITEGGRKAL